MLPKIRELVEGLTSRLQVLPLEEQSGAPQDGWGEKDIDLLVDRAGAPRSGGMVKLGSQPALSTQREELPLGRALLRLDESSGTLAHVHVYFRVLTGESLARNYRLPLEQMLLQNTAGAGTPSACRREAPSSSPSTVA